MKRAPKALAPFGSLFVLIDIIYVQMVLKSTHILQFYKNPLHDLCPRE